MWVLLHNNNVEENQVRVQIFENLKYLEWFLKFINIQVICYFVGKEI